MVPGVNFRDHETPADKALQKKKKNLFSKCKKKNHKQTQVGFNIYL